jgi:hypothetical protein
MEKTPEADLLTVAGADRDGRAFVVVQGVFLTRRSSRMRSVQKLGNGIEPLNDPIGRSRQAFSNLISAVVPHHTESECLVVPDIPTVG